MGSSEVATKGDVLNGLTPQQLDQFRDMARMLPAADGDGAARIVAQLLAADDLLALNKPWGSDSSAELAGKMLEIRGATYRESDFTDGLGVFLVVDAVDLNTGEPIVFTTGSSSVVAQIVAAHARGWLPAVARLVKSERPTTNGYYPLHLEFQAPARTAGAAAKGGKAG